jgi:hypothetical protein
MVERAGAETYSMPLEEMPVKGGLILEVYENDEGSTW